MKKNKAMRLASLLLVLVLMTSSIVGGTFAKYTSSVSSNDQARVAKWGFEPTTMDITDLFAVAYKNEATGVVGDQTVVSSQDQVDVIAPGTQGSATFAFAYDLSSNSNGIDAPEVDYTFKVLATVDDIDGSEVYDTIDVLDNNPSFYWTLRGTTISEEQTFQTVEQMLTAINALDGGDGVEGAYYHAGDLPDAFYGAEGKENGAAEYTVGWVWAFEDEDVGKKTSQDEYDTAMGNAVALGKLKITITVTATQED